MLEISSKYTQFSINQKILCPAGLTKWWSDRLVVNLIPKASELHFGQGVFHGDLYRLDYDLGDMNTPTPKINEDIEFQRGINVMLNPGKFSGL
jgi:hypothetical protein